MKEKITASSKITEAQNIGTATGKPYAYVVNWDSFQSLQLLSALLNKKVQVRFAEKDFESEGKKYVAGSLIITRAGNEKLGESFDKIVSEASQRLSVSVAAIKSGAVTQGSDFGSGYVSVIKAPKVAVIGGNSVSPTAFGDIWHYFDQQIDYPVTVIDASYLGNVDFSAFNVMILPSGSYGNILTEKRLEDLSEWVNKGGKLIALDNAVASLAGKAGFEIKKKEDKKEDPKQDSYELLKNYGNRERESLSEDIPGAIYRLDLDNSHPLAFGFSKSFMVLKGNGTPYAFLKPGMGWNVGTIKTNNHISGFVGSKTKAKLVNSVVFGVQDMGNGKVIYLTDSPIFRGFWHSGKLLFGNAVFLVGN
ncbi:MAG: hypothetical protein H7Y04_15485 [Verrucomicrobia bacterium]|nr:hypothetical protein [Cytophagales bacterium]